MYVNINLQILTYLFTTYLATIVINQLQIQTGELWGLNHSFLVGVAPFLSKWISGTFLVSPESDLEYYKRTIAIPLLDPLKLQMKERFNNDQESRPTQGLPYDGGTSHCNRHALSRANSNRQNMSHVCASSPTKVISKVI